MTQGKPVCWGAQRRAPRPGDVLGAPLLTEQNPQVQVPCTFLMPHRGSAPHPSEQSPAPLGQGAGCRQGTPEELVSGARGPSGPFFPAPPTGGRLPPPADSAEGGRFLGLRLAWALLTPTVRQPFLGPCPCLCLSRGPPSSPPPSASLSLWLSDSAQAHRVPFQSRTFALREDPPCHPSLPVPTLHFALTSLPPRGFSSHEGSL